MQEEAGLNICRLPDSDIAKMTQAAEVVWLDIASKSPRAKETVALILDYCRQKGYTDFTLD